MKAFVFFFIPSFVYMCMFIDNCMAGEKPFVPVFKEIRIASYPKDWGYAQKTVYPDGSMKGGHLSGEEKSPVVYETEGIFSDEDMEKLNRLAGYCLRVKIVVAKRPDQKVAGYRELFIKFSETNCVEVYLENEKSEKNTVFDDIWSIIAKYNVGGW